MTQKTSHFFCKYSIIAIAFICFHDSKSFSVSLYGISSYSLGTLMFTLFEQHAITVLCLNHRFSLDTASLLFPLEYIHHTCTAVSNAGFYSLSEPGRTLPFQLYSLRFPERDFHQEGREIVFLYYPKTQI